MGKFTRFWFVVLFLSIFSGLTACNWTLSGNAKDKVLEFSEPTADNLFAGLTAGDYAIFSRDFDDSIIKHVPAAKFTVLKQEIDDKLGNYISRQVDEVNRSDEFLVVVYQAKFEKVEQVTVEIAFHASDHSIAHLGIKSHNYFWSSM